MNIGFFENKYLSDGKTDLDIIHNAIARNKNIDLWILPEAFDTGCNIKPDTVIDSVQNVELFKQWAAKYGTAVCGSFYFKENGLIYNRFCAALPDGSTVFYDKRHLFGDFEKQHVTPGNQIVSFEYKGLRFRPIICYDLRFAVWCRNTDDYDVLLCVSQWPNQRLGDRACLCKARAIENQCYVVNVNAQGFSKTETPEYNVDVKQVRGSKKWVKIEITKEYIQSIKSKKQYLADRDDFAIKI